MARRQRPLRLDPLADLRREQRRSGANDDASGTAVSMELARVMSKHHFDATLVFLAVAGEEQGLLGASTGPRRPGRKAGRSRR